jgi:ATP-binding cassette, subfamily C (CFTR/MRP), member 4
LSVSSCIRYGLTYAVIKKILNLSEYSVKKAEIGKIMNLISNDLNLIDDKIHYIPKLFVVPFYFLGANIVIIVRYGWQGAVGTCLIMLFGGFGYLSTVFNSKIID